MCHIRLDRHQAAALEGLSFGKHFHSRSTDLTLPTGAGYLPGRCKMNKRQTCPQPPAQPPQAPRHDRRNRHTKCKLRSPQAGPEPSLPPYPTQHKGLTRHSIAEKTLMPPPPNQLSSSETRLLSLYALAPSLRVFPFFFFLVYQVFGIINLVDPH